MGSPSEMMDHAYSNKIMHLNISIWENREKYHGKAVNYPEDKIILPEKESNSGKN